MKYTAPSGRQYTLTKMQRLYLIELTRKGHLSNYPGFPSTQTARLLEERGLATLHRWHHPLSPWCLTGLTKLGQEVVKELIK